MGPSVLLQPFGLTPNTLVPPPLCSGRCNPLGLARGFSSFLVFGGGMLVDFLERSSPPPSLKLKGMGLAFS